MWIKLDDGFATHPKIVTAGREALAVQVRAICYASQHHTDGFLLPSVLPYLTYDVLNHCDDWGAFMVQHQLWDRVESGYQIHDYLDWNMSRLEYESMRDALSKAGKKGMKSRWKGKKKRDNRGYKVGNNKPYNKTITLQSTSIATSSFLNSPDSSPNLQSIPQARKKTNGLQEWPVDFALSDEMKNRAVALDLNPFLEFAKFKDHHLAKGSRFKDWNAAWRTWMRNGVEIKEARAR